ncbi:carboxypeptidase-like regulatory domain-containing protein [Candidatus Woesearchaeota archaeon]|nr:carboxypeptidase-like regulatory domain-containing protein [Candidatus Woesearchaeota archaeon]
MGTKKRDVLVVILFLFFLVLISSVTAAEECILFGSLSSSGIDDNLYCQPYDASAKTLCDKDANCDEKKHVIPQECSSLSQCQQVICNTAQTGCELNTPQGLCAQIKGTVVAPQNQVLECTQGCCQIEHSGGDFCQFGSNKYQCDQKVKTLQNGVLKKFDATSGMNVDKCNQLYCKVEIQQATLEGSVVDEQGQPIVLATVSLEGKNVQTTTASDCTYKFEKLNAGSYTIRASASGYLTSTITLNLGAGKTISQKFILKEAKNLVQLKGKVMDVDKKILADATLIYSGPSKGQVISNVQGVYEVQLTPGEYSFAVSKKGFQTSSSQVVLKEGTQEKDFTLQVSLLQGVKGTTYLDTNSNGQLDKDDKPAYGAKIYIDGVFRGFSQPPYGEYQFDVTSGTSHIITGSFQDFEAIPLTFQIKEKEGLIRNLLLTTAEGECSAEGNEKEPLDFFIAPVQGKEELQLNWKKPCKEVLGYKITRVHGEKEEALFEASPLDEIFIDTGVTWNEQYSYKIIALYSKDRQSKPIQSALLSPGNEVCGGKYDQTVKKWKSFCQVENRKTVFTCNAQNQLVQSLDCGSQGQTFFCAPLNENVAECKSAGLCTAGASPFGLFASRDVCYGGKSVENAENFCYYDYSNSISNQCSSCTKVDSCFDYRSQDACEINNCVSSACDWVDVAQNTQLIDYGLIGLPTTVTKETGSGYCAPQNYQKDDSCSLCGSAADLFENAFCTAEVCSALGACFSTKGLTDCSSCGEVPTTVANCYTYGSQLECSGNEGSDQCAWNSCSWLGNKDGGSCVKDSDKDQKDDCDNFIGAEAISCRVDNSAPETVLEGSHSISLAKPTLTFISDDSKHQYASQQNVLGIFGYCLDSTDPNAPSSCIDQDGKDAFIEVPFPGNANKETIVVSVLDSLKDKVVNGQNYVLKYYAEDKYGNREDTKEIFIFVDNVAPEFEISEDIQTTDSSTDLEVFLQGMNEPMSCEFVLTQVLPSGEQSKITLGQDIQQKIVLYQELTGIKYALDVSCTDNSGNAQKKTKEFTFDLEPTIDIVEPPLFGVVSSEDIIFKARTQVGATCELFSFESSLWVKKADFITDETGKEHQTTSIKVSGERTYAAEHKIVCKELYAQKEYEDYYHFTVDFTPSAVQAVVKEETREERFLGTNWETTFVKSPSLSFECKDAACEKIFYCMGTSCSVVPSNQYQEYNTELKLDKSTHVCYYGVDKVLNQPTFADCGDIFIEGYGIELKNPVAHYFGVEQWGISKEPVFDVMFTTKVPTKECRYDTNSNFKYHEAPGFKVLKPNAQNEYTIEKFPESSGGSAFSSGSVKKLYVLCQNKEGSIGPEQELFLSYDNSNPKAQNFVGSPNPLIEGTKVVLSINTDDKTLCKFSDKGHDTYELMNYAFPGAESDLPGVKSSYKRKLHETHYVPYYVNNFQGLKNTIELTSMCKNAAGVFSELQKLTLNIDYTLQGGITKITPQDSYINTDAVLIRVETSKNGFCKIKQDNNLITMQGSGGRVHTFNVPSVLGSHQFPIVCTMGEHQVEGKASYTLDKTKPIISKVNAGLYSCGKSEITVYPVVNENISAFFYEVYSKSGVQEIPENATSFSFGKKTPSSTNLGTLISQGSTDGSKVIKVPAGNLTLGETYQIKVKAVDLAGNEGDFTVSSGVSITNGTESVCQSTKKPGVEVLKTETCKETQFVLECNSLVGCGDINYDVSTSVTGCVPNSTYTGVPLSVSETNVVCYYAIDNIGNEFKGTHTVTFGDADGDGISDSCPDTCANTQKGKVADNEGCSAEQTPEGQKKDTDGDGLYDLFEQTYTRTDGSCVLDYLAKDSDLNGEPDGSEDYDGDGFSNFQEQTQLQDPCQADTIKESNEDSNFPVIPSAPLNDDTNVLAWVFLIVGLLAMIGSAGYLVYYYKYAPQKRGVAGGSGTISHPGQKPALGTRPQQPSIFQDLFRGRQKASRDLKHKSLFGDFTKESKEIPHLGNLLKGSGNHQERVNDLAQKYATHKDEIKPGLKKEEKGIFGKLESIAKQTKDKKINDVVGKDEAKDIFAKLKSITKKRKQ